jgi:small subunit ribosomal protein S9
LATNLSMGTGRRKTSIARVYVREGDGKITINGRKLDDYFTLLSHSESVRQPLMVTDCLGKYNIFIRVKGGGITGQADACKHGISRALVALDKSNYSTLKANGFLTRDPRMVERKKYGKKGARRRFQFSKR